ncbi:hypothetical protein GCM10022394_08700 [Zobellella aerophila]|uniref:Uncharacterized protein n=1 Tax=Zobellella aerophila TaxID=870480 RepID=A0ABP6VCZ3_9GAMM
MNPSLEAQPRHPWRGWSAEPIPLSSLKLRRRLSVMPTAHSGVKKQAMLTICGQETGEWLKATGTVTIAS